jgi:hypothetical protein
MPADTMTETLPATAGTVRCDLCHLPVARSGTNPPVLVHQAVAVHGHGEGGAVDVFFADGRCPQEGMPIPGEALALIPPAVGPARA